MLHRHASMPAVGREPLHACRYQGHVSAALVLGGVDVHGPHLFTVRPAPSMPPELVARMIPAAGQPGKPCTLPTCWLSEHPAHLSMLLQRSGLPCGPWCHRIQMHGSHMFA